jgi:HlyD family secretion protein
MRRLFYGAPAAFLAIAAAGCAGRTDDASLVASGHVEATRVRVSSKIAGRLQSLAVDEGDAVEAGREIGRIDPADLQLALMQAKAERDRAAAELRLRLAGARREDVAELEAQTKSAAVDHANAALELERMQALLDRGSGTTKARDDARARKEMAAQKLAAMNQSLARMRAGSREEEKDAARAMVAAADARIAQIEQQLTDAVIVSPISGVVTEKVAEAGELLAAGAPIGEVTNLQDAWLTVYLPEADLARIRYGQPAEVTTDGGQTGKGKVSFIASQAEFTPKNVQTRDERVKLVFKVKIALENQDGLFKPGMPAEARLAAVEGR